MPPPPPPPSDSDVKAALNKKLNDVKEKLKQYQERKNKGNKANMTDASREIETKIDDLKKKMEDIKMKYNATRRVKRSPAKLNKDKIKAQMDAEARKREKMLKKKGLTTACPFSDEDLLYATKPKGFIPTYNKKNWRGKRELSDAVKEAFIKIQNGTFLDRYDKDIPIPTRTTKRKITTTTTTETPYPSK